MAQSSKPRYAVLIVEDEALIRMHAAEIVRDLGFEAIEAADADRAISLLEAISDIAVVFTDIQMPGSIDGLRLVAVVRDRWPPVGLLVTSGQSCPPIADLPSGARFVSKPYLSHQLKRHLDALTQPAS